MTPNLASQRKMQLYRNVVPLPLESSTDRDTALEQAEAAADQARLVQRGDFIVLTIGEPMGQPGGTNTLKIVRVGSLRLEQRAMWRAGQTRHPGGANRAGRTSTE